MRQKRLEYLYRVRAVFALTLTIALGAAIASAPGLAQDEKPAPKGETTGEPIKISSDRLDSNPVEKYAEFIGNVKATQADYVITCNSLKIYYDGDLMNPGKESSGKEMLKKIVASGKVEVNSKQFTARTDQLEYDFNAQKLELTGKGSKITMDKNSIAGSKITFYRAEERFKVEGGSDNRVNAVFFSDGSVSDMFGNQESEKKAKE